MNKFPIDIVIPWVDGNDYAWRQERDLWHSRLSGNIETDANSEIRYQSWDNLNYWFRSVEVNLPWVNRIFLITWGHIPYFLKLDNPKLVVVRHDEYIPKEFLPTFNSNTIEMNLWRIESLSENFIIFNDDLFALRPIQESYYFQNDLVCDEAVESPIMPVDSGAISGWSCRMKANNIMFINRHFSKRRVQEKYYEKWFFEGYGDLLQRNKGLAYWNNFCGFHDPHMASALKKSTLKKLWDIEPDTLNKASSNRFRAESDVSWYLARYWQLCEGQFVPRKFEGKPFLLRGDNTREVVDAIVNRKYQMISLSEDCEQDIFEDIKKAINDALDVILPNMSSYEKH